MGLPLCHLHVGIEHCKTSSNPKSGWKLFSESFKSLCDCHAPLKTKTCRATETPCINSTYKKAIWKRKRLYKKYLVFRSQHTWEAYRVQRNLCTSLRRKAIQSYLETNCNDGPKSGKNFWKTVKPFLSKNGSNSTSDLTLIDNETLVTDPEQVANIMNDYYIHIADHIGTSSNADNPDDHSSVA